MTFIRSPATTYLPIYMPVVWSVIPSQGRIMMSEGLKKITAAFDRPACLGLAAVLILAAATRLIGLGSLDVWGDEVYSHAASSDLLPKLLKWETVNNESSSPWPFIEMKVARQVFGEESPLSLRMPSAMHGILSVLLLYVLLTLTVGWRTALWASILLALNPHGLEWSREGRMYTQWLSATIALVAVVHFAVEDVRLRQGTWYSWRWWLAGGLFMAVHAMNVMGTMTIAGIALWLGIAAVAEFATQRGAAIRIILGAALAGAVYLGSWGLTGIAKILMLMGNSKAAGGYEPAPVMSQVKEFLSALPGHLPLGLAVVCWIAAMAGFVLLARKGHWRLALLVIIAGMAPWLGFFSITKSHFWAPRYAFTAILLLAVGMGALLAELWAGSLLRKRVVGQVAAAALLVASVLLAGPYLKEIFFVPKMEVRKAFGVIREHGQEGEVIMLFPDYYVSFDSYKPYRYSQKASIIRGPKNTWLDVGEAFKGTFDELYGNVKPASPERPADSGPAMPKAAWVFLLREGALSDSAEAGWSKRISEVEPVLQAYGLTTDDLRALLKDDPYTITLRLSRDESAHGKIDHVVKTIGRWFR